MSVRVTVIRLDQSRLSHVIIHTHTYTYITQMSDIACLSGSLSSDSTKAASATSSSSTKEPTHPPLKHISAVAVNSHHSLTNGGPKSSESSSGSSNNGIPPSHDVSRQNSGVPSTDTALSSAMKNDQIRSGSEALGAAPMDIQDANGASSVLPEKSIKAVQQQPQQGLQGPASNLSGLPTVSCIMCIVYWCVCVRTRVFVYWCVCTHTCVCVLVCVYAHVCLCIGVCVRTRVFVCVYTVYLTACMQPMFVMCTCTTIIRVCLSTCTRYA
jgi:hypothetical protein